VAEAGNLGIQGQKPAPACQICSNGVQNYRINVSIRTSSQAANIVEDIVDEMDFIINEYKKE